jgi:hypothetical protein
MLPLKSNMTHGFAICHLQMRRTHRQWGLSHGELSISPKLQALYYKNTQIMTLLKGAWEVPRTFPAIDKPFYYKTTTNESARERQISLRGLNLHWMLKNPA